MAERTMAFGKEKYIELLDQKEAARYLGYGKAEPEKEMKEEMALCSKKLLSVLYPCCRYVKAALKWEEQLWAVFPEDNGRPLALPGDSIRKHLQGCGEVLCACLTLGAGVDSLLEASQQESMLEALLFNALANAATERLRFWLEEQAGRDFPGLEKNWLFGIGYGDLPVTIQGEFLKAVQAEEEIGLTCNEKNILIPLKSVTGFIGLKEGKTENNRNNMV